MEVFRYFWTYICSVLTSILDTPQRLGPIFPCRLGQNTSTCFRKDLVLIPIHIHCNDTTEESQEHWVCVPIDMQQTKGRAKHRELLQPKKIQCQSPEVGKQRLFTRTKLPEPKLRPLRLQLDHASNSKPGSYGDAWDTVADQPFFKAIVSPANRFFPIWVSFLPPSLTSISTTKV